jgi:CXXX repeat peptide maturase
VVTDLANFNQDAESKYTQLLDDLTEIVSHEYQRNHGVQVNIQTDRMMLVAMNNCGAGDETITLAPDGKFYICPGFYLDGKSNVGDVVTGLDIKNPQLYKLEYAPICRICDAYQCRRCIWLNKQTTLEVNTPSHEQCIMAHIERNASRKLLAKIREIGTFLPDKDIPEIAYLDPFDEVVKHK